MNSTAWLLAGLGGVATWLSLYPLVRYLDRARVLDVPNERSSHTRPTPRGGGLAVVVFALSSYLVYCWLASSLPLRVSLTYAGAAALIGAVGWLDDRYSLSAKTRFACQLAVGVMTLIGIGAFDPVTVPFVGESLQVHPVSLVATVLWVVVLVNFYNFMDGIDGIAGSQGVAAGVGWAVLGAWTGQPDVACLGLLLAATCAGFLAHNWHPARIFMGDVGSTFLGYSFAALPLMLRTEEGHVPPWALGAAVLLLWPFLFDAGFTLLRRLCRGENIFAAHRSHLYQRLVIAGCSHRFVTSLYLALAGVGGGLALLWTSSGDVGRLAVCCVLVLLCLGLWAYTALFKERAVAGVERLGTS